MNMMKTIGFLMIVGGIIAAAMSLGGWPAFAIWFAMAGNNLFTSANILKTDFHRQAALDEMTDTIRRIVDVREERLKVWIRANAHKT